MAKIKIWSAINVSNNLKNVLCSLKLTTYIKINLSDCFQVYYT
jgi:hypothetical protein